MMSPLAFSNPRLSAAVLQTGLLSSVHTISLASGSSCFQYRMSHCHTLARCGLSARNGTSSVIFSQSGQYQSPPQSDIHGIRATSYLLNSLPKSENTSNSSDLRSSTMFQFASCVSPLFTPIPTHACAPPNLN